MPRRGHRTCRGLALVALTIAISRAEGARGEPAVGASNDAAAGSGSVVDEWVKQTQAPSQPPRVLERRADRPRRAEHGGSSFVGGAGRTGSFLWPLAAVLSFIGLAAWGIRRFMPGVDRSTASSAMSVLCRHHLSSKQSLCLVRLGQRVVLVGVTPEHISALGAIDDADEAANLIAATRRSGAGSFSSTLNSLSQQGRGPLEPSDDEPADAKAVLGRLSRLSALLRERDAGHEAGTRNQTSAEPA